MNTTMIIKYLSVSLGVLVLNQAQAADEVITSKWICETSNNVSTCPVNGWTIAPRDSTANPPFAYLSYAPTAALDYKATGIWSQKSLSGKWDKLRVRYKQTTGGKQDVEGYLLRFNNTNLMSSVNNTKASSQVFLSELQHSDVNFSRATIVMIENRPYIANYQNSAYGTSLSLSYITMVGTDKMIGSSWFMRGTANQSMASLTEGIYFYLKQYLIKYPHSLQ